MINVFTPFLNVLNVSAITPIKVGDYVTISHDRFYSNGSYIAYCYDKPTSKTPLFEAFYDSIGIVQDIRDGWIQIEFTGGSLYKANLVDNNPAHNFLKTPQKGWIKQGPNNSNKNIVTKCENVEEIQRNFDDKYVHQCYSTQPGFTGRSACAPTACIIACAIFGKIETKENPVKRTPALSESIKPAFNVNAKGYGFYVNNAYTVGQNNFNHEEEHQVSGNVIDKGKGAWGQINTMPTQADSRADSLKMQPFLEKHGLKVFDITTTYSNEKTFFTKVSSIIGNNGLVIIGGDGHYKVIVGYGRDIDYNTDFYLVLDPYGNKALMKKLGNDNIDGYAIFNKVIYLYNDFSNKRKSDPVRILEIYDDKPDPCITKPKPEIKINTFEYDSNTKKVTANWQLVNNERCDTNFEYEISVNGVSQVKNITSEKSATLDWDVPTTKTTFEISVTPKDCCDDGSTAKAEYVYCKSNNCGYEFNFDPDIPSSMYCNQIKYHTLLVMLNGQLVSDRQSLNKLEVEASTAPLDSNLDSLEVSFDEQSFVLSINAKNNANCGKHKINIVVWDRSASPRKQLLSKDYIIEVTGSCARKVKSITLVNPKTGEIECAKPANLELKIDMYGCKLDTNKDLSFEMLLPDGSIITGALINVVSLNDQGILNITINKINFNNNAILTLKISVTIDGNGNKSDFFIPIKVVCNVCGASVRGINADNFTSGKDSNLEIDMIFNNCNQQDIYACSMIIETYLSNPPSGDPYQKYVVLQPTKMDGSLYKYSTLIRFDTCVSAVGTVRISLFKADKTLLTSSDHRVTITYNGPARAEISPDLPLMLEVGKTEQFKVALYDSLGMELQNSSAGCSITWKSTDESKVTIDINGKVTALAPGFTEIYAIVSCGNCLNIETKKITIQVYPKPVLVAKIKDNKLPYINLECEKTLPFEIYAFDSMVEKNAPYKVDYLNNSSLFRITVEQLVTNPNDSASIQKPLPLFNNSVLTAVDVTYRYPIRVTVQYRDVTMYVDVMIFRVAKIDIDRSILVVAPNKSYNLSMFAYDEYGQVLNRFTQNDFKMEVVSDNSKIIDTDKTGKGFVIIRNTAPNKATASLRISLSDQCTKAYKLFNILVQQNIKRIEAKPAKGKVSIGEKIIITVIAYDEFGNKIANPDIQNTTLNDDGSILIFSHKNSDGTESFYEFVTTGCNSKEIIFFWINDPNVKTGVRIDVWLPKKVIIDPQIDPQSQLIKGKPGDSIQVKLYVIDENNRTIPCTSFRWEIDSQLGYVLPGLDGSVTFILGSKTCDKLSFQDENKVRVWTQGLCVDIFGETYVFIESNQPLNLDFDIICINDNALTEVGSWISIGIKPINLPCNGTGDLFLNGRKVPMTVGVQANVITLVPYQILPGKNCITFKIVSHQKNNGQTVVKNKEVCFYGSYEKHRKFVIDKSKKMATVNGVFYKFPPCKQVRTKQDLSKPFPNQPVYDTYVTNRIKIFDWLVPNIKGVKYYILQISTDSKFATVLNSKGIIIKNKALIDGISTNNASWLPTFNLPLTNDGTVYYWRVVAVFDNKKNSGFSIASKFTLVRKKPQILTTEPETINGTNFTGLRDLCELGLGAPTDGTKCLYCQDKYQAINWNAKTQTAVIVLHKHYDQLPKLMSNIGVSPAIFKSQTSNSYFDKVWITVTAGKPEISFLIRGARVNNRGIPVGNNMPYEFKYQLKLRDSAKPYLSTLCSNRGRLMIPMSPFFKGLTKVINLAYYWDQNNPSNTYDIDNPDSPPGDKSVFTVFEKDGEHIKNGCFCIEDSVYWDNYTNQAIFKYVP